MTKSGRADMITMLAMGWNKRKVDSLHKTLAKRFLKTTQRAEIEAANLQRLQHDLGITLDDLEQWAEDVKQWAATEKRGAHSSREELQREIDEIIYSLRRKKHDLYRQNDSNQTRHRKRRRLGELKKKLGEKIIQYNTVAANEDKIDTEAACSLSDVILPWEAQGDVVSLRTKQQLFDQVLLVRRMEEEKPLIVKEMTQHHQCLRKAIDKLDHLLHHTEENIKNHTTPTDMTEAGYRGLHCCLLQKKDALQKKLSAVTSTYVLVDTDPGSFDMLEEDMEDCEEDDSSSELSDGEGEM
ncbi:uncharacterized protein LOC131455382 [Solea solea]|uniref:uncharacterized protein LOC131455382 n=1 Tax=Solea solea TaxID=90069 RepID=UPI002729A62A|nr:uncharacterized protein LOC131455382 [Solea solea]